ncbi:AraC-like DNA-binding protein [Mucilaginibacter sp. UYP25]|uniref:hypothetical protein n=1 Tax=unclassified Mucilaginibacter TaxID=2617802 RepID=UPI003390C7CB
MTALSSRSIKSTIITHIHYLGDKKFNFPEVLADELHKDYSVLSNLFSEKERITIEQNVINQTIEKVKKSLAYNELSLNEIPYRLN